MLPLKLVLDTNVVVSAVLKPAGAERVALTFALTEPARMFVSEGILNEYAVVLRRPKLKISELRVAEIFRLVSGRAVMTAPSRRLEVTADPDDNMFLECADAGRADYLITGNKRHFPRFWKATKVINALELLEVIAPHLTARRARG